MELLKSTRINTDATANVDACGVQRMMEFKTDALDFIMHIYDIFLIQIKHKNIILVYF